MTILSEYTKRKKFTAKGRLGSENNEFKKQPECELHSKVPSITVVGKLTIRVRSLEHKNYNRFDQVYQFHQNRFTSFYDGRLQRQVY